MCTYDMKGEVKVSRGTNGTKCSGEKGESWDGRSLLDVHSIIVWKYLCVTQCHGATDSEHHTQNFYKEKKSFKVFFKRKTQTLNGKMAGRRKIPMVLYLYESDKRK